MPQVGGDRAERRQLSKTIGRIAMACFVLVHGAWHGSWCWKRVRKALQAVGHDVFTPTLTGVAERSHLASPSVDLGTHIDDVVNLIRWEQLSDVVLCGHSYGGCVISGVADRISDHIRALVYLDAYVLEDGESLVQHLPAAQQQLLFDSVKTVGEGWRVPPIPAEVLNVNSQDRDWVDRQCTMQPIDCFRERIRLVGGIRNVKNVTFVLATGFDGSPFPPFYAKAKANGWKALTMACGHDVMLDKPEELTALLADTIEPSLV
jgi:pimeloyl-ACP methyl ester carboxylesterase